MQDFEKLGAFYLGKRKDNNDILLYDSKDLVTHAVCVGMTGSGKTGLCLSLLEEAAVDGIPALIIDPKGDLANLLLTFPDFDPANFEPWVNEDEARAAGKDVATFAKEQAELWKSGLAKWGQDGARIQRLRDSADFTIYTPGSDAGMPVSILKSFAAPDEKTMSDRELVRDRIGATVTSLLGLVGIDADPVQSREHVLMATLFDTAWKNGQDLDLGALIAQIQAPPFTKVGVMDLDSFYPAKERFGLAMTFNNLLASPGFEAWLQGEPLDIDRLLWTEAGKPRMSILSIAHLSDAERMFFVSLLLNQTLSWVRAQSGTTSLRAILYMDEIFGYFPPVANPPSKKPLLTLLKQARAFGLGVVLATQNPVDLDYKGLANIGTWFIGRLQTERDKARMLEGLEGAAASTGGRFDRGMMEQTLAGLGKRVFLLNSVHENEPVQFESRWAMSYLRGPLARPQIKALMDPKKQGAPPPAAKPAAPSAGASARPVLPPEVTQFFVPASGEIAYQPRALAAADIRFLDPKAGVDEVRKFAFLAPITDAAVPVNWEDAVECPVSLEDLDKEPAEGASWGELPAAAAKAKNYATWQKSFSTWLLTSQTYDLLKSPSAGLTSNPGESERDFRIRAAHSAREDRDATVQSLREKFAPRIAALEERRRRAEQAVQREKEQSQSQMLSGALSVGGALLSAFMGRKVISATTISKATTAARSISKIGKESSDVNRAAETVEAIQQQVNDLQAQVESQVQEIQAAADPQTETLDKISIKPKKTNIAVQLVALAWSAE
jgi:hypothetical protein